MAEYDIPAAARDSLPRKLSTHADVISLSLPLVPTITTKTSSPSPTFHPPPSTAVISTLSFPSAHPPLRLRSLELQTNSYIGGKCLYGTCGRFLGVTCLPTEVPGTTRTISMPLLLTSGCSVLRNALNGSVRWNQSPLSRVSRSAKPAALIWPCSRRNATTRSAVASQIVRKVYRIWAPI